MYLSFYSFFHIQMVDLSGSFQYTSGRFSFLVSFLEWQDKIRLKVTHFVNRFISNPGIREMQLRKIQKNIPGDTKSNTNPLRRYHLVAEKLQFAAGKILRRA